MFLKCATEVDLYSGCIALGPDGLAQPVEPAVVRDPIHAPERAVMAFRAEPGGLHPEIWERHPAGNEVLVVMSGVVDVHLREDGVGPTATLGAGEAFIVPTGSWHRLRVVETAELLTITPPGGTEHEHVTDHEDAA